MDCQTLIYNNLSYYAKPGNHTKIMGLERVVSQAGKILTTETQQPGELSAEERPIILLAPRPNTTVSMRLTVIFPESDQTL